MRYKRPLLCSVLFLHLHVTRDIRVTLPRQGFLSIMGDGDCDGDGDSGSGIDRGSDGDTDVDLALAWALTLTLTLTVFFLRK